METEIGHVTSAEVRPVRGEIVEIAMTQRVSDARLAHSDEDDAHRVEL